MVTRYDKRFCSNTEITDWYTPGRECCVFEVDGWRFGCALCIEIQFPEVFQGYAELDVDCILFSSYSDEPMFGIQAQGYAASHSYWVSVSVPTQTSHGLSSRLIAPTGEVQADGDAVGVRDRRRSARRATARDGKSPSIAPGPGEPRHVTGRSIGSAMSRTREANVKSRF